MYSLFKNSYLTQSIIFLLIIFFLTYLGIAVWLYLSQRSILYKPEADHGNIEDYNLLNTKEIFLTTLDGIKIQTWIHKPDNKNPYIIYFHGNANNLVGRKEKFRDLIQRGYGLIAISWRGYGKSQGSPSKEGLYNDARAAIQYLHNLGIPTKESLVIGESLGSGIAMKMAVEHQFKGVVLISPYTSTVDLGQERYWYLPIKWILKDNFNNLDKIDKIQSPLLIVHGDHDQVIPHQHSLKLIMKALEPKKIIIYPDKIHNNLDYKKIYNDMGDFFF